MATPILLSSILLPAVTAFVTAFGTFLVQERKLRTELRTEFLAERAALVLLRHPAWQMRTFEAIEKRIGGFDANELRRILVRTGAVRFKGRDGSELWGLLERNSDKLDERDQPAP